MKCSQLGKSVKVLLINRYLNYLFVILFISHLSVDSLGQQPGIKTIINLDSLERKANSYLENHPAEKVYLQFDKPFYGIGEDSWYKAYVVNGSDFNPTNISSVLYVDWISPLGKVINHQQLRIENGGAVGDFAIDTTLRAGTYTVRAYTNWMRNDDPELFYAKKIQVFDPRVTQGTSSTKASLSPIDLQFFPEGGTLVAGIKTQIAFKAIQANGKGIDIQGKIVDEQNKLVTTFRSSHSGMGSFPFIGDVHKSFRAVLPGGEVYPLPVPSESGLMLAASNMNSSKILVQIQSIKKDSVVYLIGQSRGTICYAESIKMHGALTDISISKKDLPEGILQLTLFDKDGVPQCERMLFIKKDNRIIVSINSDKKQYAPRDSIILNFKVDDLSGDPLETSLSVSVTDADYISEDRNSENIYTRLLLQSDLKGKVENPGWYFETQTPEKIHALDLVMLTHGWSGYNWKKVLNPSPESILFEPETGITLEGQILASNRPVPNAPFTMAISQPGNQFVNLYESDSLGKFKITDLSFSDTTLISWRVMGGKKGRVQNAAVQLDTAKNIPPVTPYYTKDQVGLENQKESMEKLTTFIKSGRWNFNNAILLNEFVLKAARTEIKAVGINTIAVKPQPEDLKRMSSTFVNRYTYGLSGARFVTMPDGTDIWTTQQGAPIQISINGVMHENTGLGANPFVVINAIPIEQIEVVIISGGSIAIITKNETAQVDLRTIKQIAKGYITAREFYHPKYGPADISATGPDNRLTLYWNANLRTNKAGFVTAKFYNTDSTQKIRIVVEGIANGIPFSAVQIVGTSE